MQHGLLLPSGREQALRQNRLQNFDPYSNSNLSRTGCRTFNCQLPVTMQCTGTQTEPAVDLPPVGSLSPYSSRQLTRTGCRTSSVSFLSPCSVQTTHPEPTAKTSSISAPCHHIAAVFPSSPRLLEHRNYGTFILLIDKLLHLIALKGFHKCLNISSVFITFSNSYNVSVGFSC